MRRPKHLRANFHRNTLHHRKMSHTNMFVSSSFFSFPALLTLMEQSQAAALALCKVPQCNSSWTDSYIRQWVLTITNFFLCTLHLFDSFTYLLFVYVSSSIHCCRYHNVNINVAVQTENGLFVPVIKVMWFLSYIDCMLPCSLGFNICEILWFCRMQTRRDWLK